jgi:predicted O-methyltransferase YrrM
LAFRGRVVQAPGKSKLVRVAANPYNGGRYGFIGTERTIGGMRLLSANSELARAMREEIRQAYLRGYVEGSDGRHYEIFPDSITPERAAFVESICSFARPTVTLEIGMAWGLSTLSILSTQCESTHGFHPHVVIDPWQAASYRRAALLSLRRAGAEALIEFHHQPSVAVLPRLSGRKFDFVFVDGAHHYSAVFCDLWLLHPLLRPGSVVVVDDVWFDDIGRACKFAEINLGYKFHSEYPSGGQQPLLRAYVVEPVARDDQRFGDKFRRARSRLLRRYRRDLMIHALRRLHLMRPATHPKVAKSKN